LKPSIAADIIVGLAVGIFDLTSSNKAEHQLFEEFIRAAINRLEL